MMLPRSTVPAALASDCIAFRLLPYTVPDGLFSEYRTHCNEQKHPVGLPCLTLQLESIPSDINSISNCVAFIRGMGLLQEIRHVLENLIRGKGKILAQNSELFLTLRKINQNLRLQTRVDIFGKVECRRVVVHRGYESEILMCPDL